MSYYWRGGLLPHANLECDSHSGSVEVRLTAQTGGEFTVSTFEGSVRNEFGPSKLVHARELKGRELQCALPGDQDARIIIRNYKGPMLLLKQ